MFPESLYFWAIQNCTLNYATFPSKYSLYANIHFYQRLNRCWKHPWKPNNQNLFSSSFAFLIMSAASQKHSPFSADFSQGKRWIWAGARWDAAVLTLCSLLRNPWPQSTGVLKNFHEGETNCWFFIYHGVSSSASLRRGVITTYTSLFIVLPSGMNSQWKMSWQ